MALGLFFRRASAVSTRRRGVFADRVIAVVMAGTVVAICVGVWDWHGWDRASVGGAARFALVAFAWTAAVQMMISVGLVPVLIAPAIASERDRKSLDSLLVTRLSAAEIVLGTMGAGLLWYACGLVALAPLAVLMMFLGGIDPGLVVLAALVLVSTAIALGSLAIAASATARTASRAVTSTVAITMAWLGGPHLVVMLLPRLWPAAARWLVSVAVRVLDSSPLVLALSLSGVVPRGPLVVVVLRMIALQGAASVALVLWAIVRLRPASRAAYDVANRAGILRALRARWRPRPACGDNPVLWYAIHGGIRNISGVALWADRLFNVLWVGLLLYGVSWFALPAFAELMQLGYSAAPASATAGFPELNPVARVVVARSMGFSSGPAPGQARLELNVVLRQLTGIFDILYCLMITSAAAYSVAKERESNTWLGLIATPLSGREILRGKRLGAMTQTRGVAALMVALWTVGLLTGAVHPLGFLAALVGLGVSCWFLASLGVAVSLRARDRSEAGGWVLSPLMFVQSLGALPFLCPGVASVLAAAAAFPFQAWAALLSYEDVRAAIHGTPVPSFAAIGIRSAVGAWIVAAGWLFSTAAQVVGALLLTRSADARFDAVIGRPIRARAAAPRA